ncbi:MAG: hypothetical protein WAZ34_01015 [Rhodocyclaceae bacterium]
MSAQTLLGKIIATAGIALALSAGSAFAADHGAHKHEHGHAATPEKLSLNDGRKWGTDEALRKGMENIRQAMDASLHQIHEGKLSTAGYAALAKKINEEVGEIVAHCKLDPKADAQLHVVIAEMGEGIEAMAGRLKKTKRLSGAVKILGALDHYNEHFDHPGWQAIKH